MAGPESWILLDTNEIDIAQLEIIEQTIWNHPDMKFGNFTDDETGRVLNYQQISAVSNNWTNRIRVINSQEEKRFEFSRFYNSSPVGDPGEKAILGVIGGELYLNRKEISTTAQDDAQKAFGLIADVRNVFNV